MQQGKYADDVMDYRKCSLFETAGEGIRIRFSFNYVDMKSQHATFIQEVGNRPFLTVWYPVCERRKHYPFKAEEHKQESVQFQTGVD